jgi:RecA/RadA recombinase
MTRIVNLFGPPSAGKTTVAYGILYKLKMAGYCVEFAPEYAKELVWRDDRDRLANQWHILEEQSARLAQYEGKVDIVVTDGPVLLTSFYNQKYHPHTDVNELDDMAMYYFERFSNVNFFIERLHPYEARGRYQTDTESFAIQDELRAFLDKRQVSYTTMHCTDNFVDAMVTCTKIALEMEQK